MAEAPRSDGGGFFLDIPLLLAKPFVDKLNFYKLRAKVLVEDCSATLGVMAVWDGQTMTQGRPVLARSAATGARMAHDVAA